MTWLIALLNRVCTARPAAAPAGPPASAPTTVSGTADARRHDHLLIVVARFQAGASTNADVSGRAGECRSLGLRVAAAERELAVDRREAHAGAEEIAEIECEATRNLAHREQTEQASHAGLHVKHASGADRELELAFEAQSANDAGDPFQ